MECRSIRATFCIIAAFAIASRVGACEFERNGEVVKINPSSPLIANMLDVEVQACVDGIGVISTFEEALQPHLENRALVEALKDWQQPFSGPYIYYPSRRHMPAPLRAFVDFVKSTNVT